MKVLIVGGAGYVGSIIRPAMEAEYNCHYFDLRPVAGAEDRTILADVNDDAAVSAALAGVESVVYLAMGTGKLGDNTTVRDIDAAFNVNVRGLYRFLYRGLAAGVRRFCYASTLSIYRGWHRYDGLFDETMPPDNWEPYGLSKRVGEFICEAAAQKYPDASVLVLRLVLPRNEKDYERQDAKTDAGHFALGPNDTRRLFAAAAKLQRPGYHVAQAMGDPQNKHFSLRRAMDLLGWQPRDE